MEIGMVIIKFLVGVGIGIAAGFLGWFFKFIRNKKVSIVLKAIWCILWALGFVVGSTKSGYNEAKYTAALCFGYVNNRLWGTEKPAKEIAFFWFFLQPVLFGSIGASLDFSKLNTGDFGYGAIIIIGGVLMRVMATIIATGG
jgi:NhaP-type Na+/H+ or K+/H+ antiporter